LTFFIVIAFSIILAAERQSLSAKLKGEALKPFADGYFAAIQLLRYKLSNFSTWRIVRRLFTAYCRTWRLDRPASLLIVIR